MKRAFIAFVGLIFWMTSWAQQEQQYTQYMINPFVLNPAVAGTQDFIDINLGFRGQWLGLEAAPITYYASGHGTFKKEEGQYHHKGEHNDWHGIGGYVYQDYTGPIKRTSGQVAYAYNMPVTNDVRLSMGMFFGLKSVAVRSDYWENIHDPQDGLFTKDFSTGPMPDLGVGIHVYHDYFFAGVSSFQVFKSDLRFGGSTDLVNPGKLNRHYFVTGGLNLPTSEHITLMPSIMLKYSDPAPVSVDVSMKIIYTERFWTGFSYRHKDSFSVIAGTEIHEQIDISYAFDYTISRLRYRQIGSHEIILGLRLKHPKHPSCPGKYW